MRPEPGAAKPSAGSAGRRDHLRNVKEEDYRVQRFATTDTPKRGVCYEVFEMLREEPYALQRKGTLFAPPGRCNKPIASYRVAHAFKSQRC
jgi:hypothetical protein